MLIRRVTPDWICWSVRGEGPGLDAMLSVDGARGVACKLRNALLHVMRHTEGWEFAALEICVEFRDGGKFDDGVESRTRGKWSIVRQYRLMRISGRVNQRMYL
jgi:hypothetical protein